jgi:hypothetical protein
VVRVRAAVAFLLLLVLAACKKSYSVGDHVYVEWDGKDYPAMILSQSGPTKYKVHYDGYDAVWDEVVVRERVRGHVEGNVINPEPPAKVRAKALVASQTNVHKVGDRVRVEWHGQLYPAVITAIVGQEKYRIHYDGYGTEWDETVGGPRIQPR